MQLRKFIVSLLLLTWLPLYGPQALPRGTNLYLKDGTFHLVREYELKGNRVRFYSLERSGWEELPKELIDLEATERIREEEEQQKEKEFQEAARFAAEKPVCPTSQGVQVQPGVILPLTQGVFLFDGHRIIRLIQTQGEVVADKKRNVLGSVVPILKRRSFVVVPGRHAALRTLNPTPVLYLQFSEGKPPQFVLIELLSKKKTRRVEVVTVGTFGGHPKESRRPITVKTSKVAGRIYQMEPTDPLPQGEYAVAEILNGEQLNMGVWDFGVDEFQPEKGELARNSQ